MSKNIQSMEGLELTFKKRRNEDIRYGAFKLEFIRNEEFILNGLNQGYSKSVIFEYLKSNKKIKMGRSIFYRYCKELENLSEETASLSHPISTEEPIVKTLEKPSETIEEGNPPKEVVGNERTKERVIETVFEHSSVPDPTALI